MNNNHYNKSKGLTFIRESALHFITLLIYFTFLTHAHYLWRSIAQPSTAIGTLRNVAESKTLSTIQVEYDLIDEDVMNNNNVHYKHFGAFMVSRHVIKHGNESAVMISKDELSIKDWAELMGTAPNNDELIEDLTNLIIQSTVDEPGYEAYFFETKGTTLNSASSRQFEFALIQSDKLHEISEKEGPKPETFQDHLNCMPSLTSCCTFDNLGRTARLISPKNYGNYSHIGKFLQSATKNEIHQMWKTVTIEYLSSLKRNPSKTFWLSTSGLKVSWLHFRIDEKPKSYSFSPFMSIS